MDVGLYTLLGGYSEAGMNIHVYYVYYVACLWDGDDLLIFFRRQLHGAYRFTKPRLLPAVRRMCWVSETGCGCCCWRGSKTARRPRRRPWRPWHTGILRRRRRQANVARLTSALWIAKQRLHHDVCTTHRPRVSIQRRIQLKLCLLSWLMIPSDTHQQSSVMHNGLTAACLDTFASELPGVTCHMGSHSVTSHPTQVNSPRITPTRQAGTRFTYPRGMEGWVYLGDLLHTEMVYPSKY